VNISNKIVEVPIDLLKRDYKQPRKTFAEESIESMAKTIKVHGTINPIEVDGKNVVITGEIRWRAAKLAGMKKVPIRRIKNITLHERLERQLIENLHRIELTSVERENAIYALWKSGRFKSVRELAETLGYHPVTIGDIVEAKKFRDRVVGLPDTVPTSLISETKELDDKTRLKILMKVSRGEIKRPAPQTELREIVKIVKKAPKAVRQRVLKQNIPLDEARQLVELYEKAPEPLKEAIERNEVKLEHAREAIQVYKEVKGMIPDETRVKQLVESLKSNKILDNLRIREYKDILEGKKTVIDEATIVTEIDTGYIFTCPLCMNKYRIIHSKPTNFHKLQELGSKQFHEVKS